MIATATRWPKDDKEAELGTDPKIQTPMGMAKQAAWSPSPERPGRCGENPCRLGAWVTSLSPASLRPCRDATPTIDDFDLFLLIDTTGSMAPVMHNIRSSSDCLRHTIHGHSKPRGGLGTYEDWPVLPYGISTDVPFELNQRTPPTSPLFRMRSIT